MKAPFRVILAAAVLAVAGAPGQPAQKEKPGARPDFSTPKAAVQTFIHAAQARDAELLSRCVHDKAAGEFAGLRKKTATRAELDGLAELFQGAEITGVGPGETKDTAVVNVKLKPRKESITVGRTADGWKIIDF